MKIQAECDDTRQQLVEAVAEVAMLRVLLREILAYPVSEESVQIHVLARMALATPGPGVAYTAKVQTLVGAAQTLSDQHEQSPENAAASPRKALWDALRAALASFEEQP